MPRTPHLTALGALFALACGPSLPSQGEAEAWYRSHRRSVDRFAQEAHREIEAIEWFGYREVPCDPADADPTDDSNLRALMAGANCAAQRSRRIEATNEAIRRYQAETLPEQTRVAGAMSSRVTYVVAGSDNNHVLGEVRPAPPAHKNSTVRAEAGAAIDDRRIGWGLYQTAWSNGQENHGSSQYQRGYEVLFSFRLRDATLSGNLFFLQDAPAGSE